MNKIYYLYDYEKKAIIKVEGEKTPQQIGVPDFIWKDIEPKGEYYQAIFLGKGCMDRLKEVSKEEAEAILDAFKSPPKMTKEEIKRQLNQRAWECRMFTEDDN